jgi:hypothetical protein
MALLTSNRMEEVVRKDAVISDAPRVARGWY